MSAITVPVPGTPRVLVDFWHQSLVRDAVLVLGGAAFTGLLAQLSYAPPGWVVPITGQTLGVLLVGAAYGPLRSLLSMVLYLIAGIAGIPCFAQASSGSSVVTGATGGYLVGFVLAAPLVGWLATRGRARTVSAALGAFVLGSLVVYAVGVPWLASATSHSLAWAITNGLLPFVAGDLFKALIAAGLLPMAWALVARTRKG